MKPSDGDYQGLYARMCVESKTLLNHEYVHGSKLVHDFDFVFGQEIVSDESLACHERNESYHRKKEEKKRERERGSQTIDQEKKDRRKIQRSKIQRIEEIWLSLPLLTPLSFLSPC